MREGKNDMVTATDTAQKKIAEILKEKKDVPQSVRVYLQEGGWGGPALTLALDEPTDSDSKFDNGGVPYIIDNNLLKKTGDVTIDFVAEGWKKGFTVSAENPVSVSGSCSTGDTCAAKGSCS